MLINPTQKELQLHLKALTQMSRETEWVEFKTNPDPESYILVTRFPRSWRNISRRHGITS